VCGGLFGVREARSRFPKAAASRRTPKPSRSERPPITPALHHSTPHAFASPEFSLEIGGTAYIASVKFLTKQEQMVLCLIFVLLLTGWAVKTWRAAHPAAAAPLSQKT
jgi:hypothetical protein